MKIRQVGNSNMIALPRELEGIGYRPGQTVLVEAQPDGTLLILPAEQIRAALRQDFWRHRTLDELRVEQGVTGYVDVEALYDPGATEDERAEYGAAIEPIQEQ
jgi:antitoxin component of MazEF toxin-antitoxin module